MVKFRITVCSEQTNVDSLSNHNNKYVSTGEKNEKKVSLVNSLQVKMCSDRVSTMTTLLNCKLINFIFKDAGEVIE